MNVAELTPEQFRAIRADREMRGAFAEANGGLLNKIAINLLRKRSVSGKRHVSVGLDDLMQIGRMSILECLDKFDEDLGFKFSTFAMRITRWRMERYINEHGASLGRLPSGAWNTDQEATRKARGATLMGEFRFPDGEQYEFPDSGSLVEEILEKDERKDSLTETLSSARGILTRRERDILLQRFKGVALENIGKGYSCSRERIRQIQNRAIRKLKEWIETKPMREKHVAKRPLGASITVAKEIPKLEIVRLPKPSLAHLRSRYGCGMPALARRRSYRRDMGLCIDCYRIREPGRTRCRKHLDAAKKHGRKLALPSRRQFGESALAISPIIVA